MEFWSHRRLSVILEGTCLNIWEGNVAISVTDLDISVFVEEGSPCRLHGKELSKAGKKYAGHRAAWRGPHFMAMAAWRTGWGPKA